MARQTRPPSAAALAVAAILSGAGALWYALLMRGLWAAQALGPICRHGGALIPHCSGCYAAAALMTGGVALAASAATPRLKLFAI
jgi:hypothetical protein